MAGTSTTTRRRTMPGTEPRPGGGLDDAAAGPPVRQGASRAGTTAVAGKSSAATWRRGSRPARPSPTGAAASPIPAPAMAPSTVGGACHPGSRLRRRRVRVLQAVAGQHAHDRVGPGRSRRRRPACAPRPRTRRRAGSQKMPSCAARSR